MQSILPKDQAQVQGTAATLLVLVVGVRLLIAALFVVATASRDPLLGEKSYAAIAAFHGISAGVMMVVATIGLYWPTSSTLARSSAYATCGY